MSEVERAIDIISTYNNTIAVNPDFECAMDAAIAALCEKAEREKGCEYCGLIYKLDGAAYGTVDELIDNTFCPMCGKRLEVHYEAD